MAVKSFKIDPLLLPPFDGIGAGAFTFLESLAKNQSRDWFNEHREIYEVEAHRPMVALMVELLDRRELAFVGDPVKSVFRINRDVRFSHDKSPYKTSLSAALSRGAKGHDAGVLYIHIDSEACFVAAGFYAPPKETLDAIRSTIANHPARYRACVTALAKAGLSFDTADTLTRLPRGYEGDHPDDIALALRRKSAVVRRALTRADVGSNKLPGLIAEFAKASSPIFTLV